MNSYKHGVYGEYIPTSEQVVTTSNTVPIYIGTAPVHRLIDSNDKVNKPIFISSIDEAQSKLGYSDGDDFNKYTLSAVIFAHFKNKVQSIGPIIVINVLDPNVDNVDVPARDISIINNKIVLEENTIAKSINIENKELDIDYKLGVDTTTGNIVVSFASESTGQVSLNYKNITINTTSQDIIGSYDSSSGERKGIYCIHTVYEDLNIAPNILCVPKYGQDTSVRNKLIEVCKNIGGIWDSVIYTDLNTSIDNYTQAIEEKYTSGFSSIDEKLCWPMVKLQGKKVYMSIIAIARTQQTDVKNNGIPCETPSNKPLDITGLVNDVDKEVKLTIETANNLNSKGITTALFYGGKWVLWGAHMSNFEHGKTNKPNEMFDVNRRMDIYLNNDFKKRNAERVDTQMTRNDIDSLLNTEQIRLNSLISEGKLLFGKIEFRNTANIISDLMQGNFVFDTLTTATIPAKSLTQRVQYTSQGVVNIAGGE